MHNINYFCLDLWEFQRSINSSATHSTSYEVYRLIWTGCQDETPHVWKLRKHIDMGKVECGHTDMMLSKMKRWCVDLHHQQSRFMCERLNLTVGSWRPIIDGVKRFTSGSYATCRAAVSHLIHNNQSKTPWLSDFLTDIGQQCLIRFRYLPLHFEREQQQFSDAHMFGVLGLFYCQENFDTCAWGLGLKCARVS